MFMNCTPILNNGMKYCLSRRGWGQLMADACDIPGLFAYTKYAFGGEEDDPSTTENLPTAIDIDEEITAEADLNEVFDLTDADIRIEQGSILIKPAERLRYIDKGDTLIISKRSYSVLSVDRRIIKDNDFYLIKTDPSL